MCVCVCVYTRTHYVPWDLTPQVNQDLLKANQSFFLSQEVKSSLVNSKKQLRDITWLEPEGPNS